MGKRKQRQTARKGSKLKAAVELGARGGRVGGPARAQVLTAERRKQIAKLGGKARQSKKGKK